MITADKTVEALSDGETQKEGCNRQLHMARRSSKLHAEKRQRRQVHVDGDGSKRCHRAKENDEFTLPLTKGHRGLNWTISKLDESCISNPKLETLNWTVQFKISNFGFEMQDSSNFEIVQFSVFFYMAGMGASAPPQRFIVFSSSRPHALR